MRTNKHVFAASAVLAAGILHGCTPSARQQYDAAGSTAAEAARQTGKAIKTDAAASEKVLAKDSKAAEAKLQTDAVRADAIASNDQSSTLVKTALIGAKDLHASHIHVDTDGHTTTLSGSVPSASEKHRAALIAKEQLGPWFTVLNKLVVAGG